MWGVKCTYNHNNAENVESVAMYICRGLGGGGDNTLCYVGQYFQSDPRICACLFMCKGQYLCVRMKVGGGMGGLKHPNG